MITILAVLVLAELAVNIWQTVEILHLRALIADLEMDVIDAQDMNSFTADEDLEKLREMRNEIERYDDPSEWGLNGDDLG